MKYQTDYERQIKEGKFEDLFISLSNNANAIENSLEQRKHVRDFMGLIDEVFDEIVDSGKLNIFASEFIYALRNIPVLEESGKKLPNLIGTDKINGLYSLLLIEEDLENADFLLHFASNNLENFPNTVNKIINDKKIKSLMYVCRNMSNTHYGKDEILRKSYDLPFNVIESLIEEYHFDLNSTNTNSTNSLLAEVVVNKNLKLFKNIVDKYSNSINWGQTYSINNDSMTIFDMISKLPLSNALSFFSVLLEEKHLKSNAVNKIASYLFKKEETIKIAAETDIYEKLFNHPEFDHSTFNLGQGYCLYGLLTQIGTSASSKNNYAVSKAYMKIIESFIDSRKNDEMPPAAKLHIVGAAVYVASESPSEETLAVCNLIVRKYKNYINKTNPDGSLPIMQVNQDNLIYRLLVNNGAIIPNPPLKWWANMFSAIGLMKKQDLKTQILERERELELERSREQVTQVFNNSLSSLKVKMRDDFREMRSLLANPLCDDVVRMRCENMFLSATNLVNKMEKYEMENNTEDIHFLNQNFAVYLKKSIKAYVQVCEATVDFAHDEDLERKLIKAKNDCLESVDLLDKQLNLINNNLFSQVDNETQKRVQVNKRFIETKLEGNDKLSSFDQQLNNINEGTKKIVPLSDEDLLASVENSNEQSSQKITDNIVNIREGANYDETKEQKNEKSTKKIKI